MKKQELKQIGTVLKQNSTHKAVVSAKGIDIILKGLLLPADEYGPEMNFPEERLYSIANEDKDNLFWIFEELEEEMRILIAEA
jgi:hypothetical protein